MTSLIPEEGLIADWVALYADITEAPPEAFLAVAATTISACIGWHMWTAFGDKHEPCNVSMILVGSSGAAKKSTLLGSAAKMMEIAYMGDPEPSLRVRRQGHASSRGIIEALAPREESDRDLWQHEPPPRHVWAWDEIGKLMKNDGSWKDETRGVLLSSLEGYQPGAMTGKKKGSDPALPSRCSLSIIGTMTRTELEEKSRETVLTDGFLGRFLLVDVAVTGKSIAFPPERSTEMAVGQAQIARALRAICERPPKGCITDAFSTAAKIERIRWYSSWGERIRALEVVNEIIGGAVRNHFARLQATCARIAMVLAVSGGREKISLEDELLAQEMVGRSLDTIAALAAVASVSEQDVFAQRLMRVVSLNGGIPLGQAIQTLRPAGLDWQKAEYVVRLLATAGEIAIEPRTMQNGDVLNYLTGKGSTA